MMALMSTMELSPASLATSPRSVVDVARPVEVVESTLSCRSLEDLFRPERVECVAVLDPADQSRIGLVTRDRCAAAMSGELGYGRALLFRRAVSELTDWSPTVVDPWVPVADALAVAMARPRRHRYDDLLVRSRVWASVSVAVLVDALHGGVPEAAGADGVRAGVDALTGVLDRSSWLAALGERCGQAAAPGSYVLVVVVSVVGLAAVNADHGLAAGDAVLASAAEGLQHAGVGASVVGRLSGTQLALVAPVSAHDDEGAVLAGDALAEQLRAAGTSALRAAAAAHGVPAGTLRARVGYAVAPAGVSGQTLLTHGIARVER